MFGLDERIAASADGASIGLVLAVAVVLGLRHATDPDHLAAVTTLVASGGARARSAGELGLAWGLGHAATLFAFGVPIILFNGVLPQRVQQATESAVGGVVVYLALRLLVRWRRGELSFHEHPRAHDARTRRGAFAIGLVHGMGGSAGVGVLVVASVRSTAIALTSLALLAVFTAVSMTVLLERARLDARLASRRGCIRCCCARSGRGESCLRDLVRDRGLEPHSILVLDLLGVVPPRREPSTAGAPARNGRAG